MVPESTATVAGIYRYPVKGLGPEQLQSVELTAGEALPLDRAWAIENGAGRFDPENPIPLPKTNFLMLMRNERLAALETRFDESDNSLTILRNGKQVARGALDTVIGRQIIEQFLAAYMPGDLRGAPHIVSAPGHSFSDVGENVVHIVNLASVRELERLMQRQIDPLRFRANLYVETAAPWAEFEWVAGGLRVGEARLSVTARTDRCAATNVDPKTGARDMAIPAALERAFGHHDFGVYAVVEAGGWVRSGDPVSTL